MRHWYLVIPLALCLAACGNGSEESEDQGHGHPHPHPDEAPAPTGARGAPRPLLSFVSPLEFSWVLVGG